MQVADAGLCSLFAACRPSRSSSQAPRLRSSERQINQACVAAKTAVANTDPCLNTRACPALRDTFAITDWGGQNLYGV